uniref:Bee-milk protein n=2 Tax=Pectinophora gossypiella TaxID=13191 RepID=A0A1E1W8A9_PECGO
MAKFIFLSLCVFFCCLAEGASNLNIYQQWSKLEFVFPTAQDKQKALTNGWYVEDDIVNPIDVDVHYNSTGGRTVFITVPRFDTGRPITLGTVDSQGRINAYPNYAWHDNQGSNCDGFTSVWRTAIDKCHRLWAIDAGKIGDNWVCPPKLVAFNLTTNELIFTHQFNGSSYITDSLYITPAVDVRNADCSNTFVYLADVTARSLGVVDVDKNVSWRITHRLFHPYPSAGTFVIDGDSFDLMDGVLGLALSPVKNNDRNLYFHALASVNENVVKTSVIRNSAFLENSEADPNSINVLPGRRSNQSAAEAMDSKGILYYGLMSPPSLWCWNSNTVFSQENFWPIGIDQETLQFASGVKVIVNSDGDEELWVMTSSFQRVMTGTMSANETNFRIHYGSLSKILKLSPCRSTINNPIKIITC